MSIITLSTLKEAGTPRAFFIFHCSKSSIYLQSLEMDLLFMTSKSPMTSFQTSGWAIQTQKRKGSRPLVSSMTLRNLIWEGPSAPPHQLCSLKLEWFHSHQHDKNQNLAWSLGSYVSATHSRRDPWKLLLACGLGWSNSSPKAIKYKKMAASSWSRCWRVIEYWVAGIITTAP